MLGNHDVASTRDPFSRPADLSGVAAAVLLDHESEVLDVRGRKVQVAGEDHCGIASFTAGSPIPRPTSASCSSTSRTLCKRWAG